MQKSYIYYHRVDIEEELKLREGLEFSNLEEYEKFYKSYAHHVGFSVRK